MIDLRLGDCIEVLPTLDDDSVDLVVTSPPYFNAKEYSHWRDYQDYLAFLFRFFRVLSKPCRNPSIAAINLSCVIDPRESRADESTRYPIPFDAVKLAMDAGWKFVDDIVWQKPDGASSRARTFNQHRRPVAYKSFQVTEYIMVFKWGDKLLDAAIHRHSDEQIEQSLVADGYERTNVWKLNPDYGLDHPALMPQPLADRLVSYYSFVGDTILDPFMGSGTTGVACVKFNRNFIGCEIDPHYFEIAKRRIEQESIQPVMV